MNLVGCQFLCHLFLSPIYDPYVGEVPDREDRYPGPSAL